MIEDLRDASGPSRRSADVCIVGAGPAGLAIACAFAGSRFRVLLLESGGLHSELATHDLLAGRSIGELALEPGASRLRAWGGSCRRWGGGCMPLAPEEFEPRAWVPDSGWPISYRDLARHYGAALRFCGLDPDAYARAEQATPRRRGPAFDPAQLMERPFLKTTVEFGAACGDALRASPNVHVLLHANLLELDAGESGQAVREARVAGPDGRCIVVHARHYVLAAGGLDNARLLLASRSTAPQGLGNRHDQVGRWFQEHPRCRLGVLLGGQAAPLLRAYGRHATVERATYRELALSPALQARHRVLSARMRPFPIFAAPGPGVQSLRELRGAFRKRPGAPTESDQVEAAVTDALDAGLPPPLAAPDASDLRAARAVLAALAHPREIAAATARRLRHGSHLQLDAVALEAYFEQAPNRDSRVMLDDTRDAFGQPRVRVDWRLTPLDHATHREAARVFGTQVAQACGGRFLPDAWIADPEGSPSLHGSAHHMGTTRMSDDAAGGVVDTQCRVHGIDNLYVAGSSVFPTSAWAFPTLTLVALSVRLADHLRTRLEALEPLAQMLGV